MGKHKVKKEKFDASMDKSDDEINISKKEERILLMCPIAKPMAPRKLTKRLYKTVKLASQSKSLRKGIREVQKYLRKGERGVVVMAGDVSPVDVYSHMPAVCEDKGITYCFVPSKEDLGHACGSKKQTCIVLIKEGGPSAEHTSLMEKVVTGIKELPRSY